MRATPGRRISSTLRNANRALALGPSLASAVEESQGWRAGAGLLGPEWGRVRTTYHLGLRARNVNISGNSS